MIESFPNIKKFENPKASFPLFDALGELYDGHLAEGNYNFKSLELPQYEEPLRQIPHVEDDIQVLDGILAEEVQDKDPDVHRMEDDDIQVLETRADSMPRNQEAQALATAQNIGQQRRVSAATKQDKKERKKESKKAEKSSHLETVVERYLDMRNKQVEDENALLARKKQIAEATDFSIKKCISILNKIEVTKVEKVIVYSIFKSKENREIFLSSHEEDKESALMWLQAEMEP